MEQSIEQRLREKGIRRTPYVAVAKGMARSVYRKGLEELAVITITVSFRQDFVDLAQCANPTCATATILSSDESELFYGGDGAEALHAQAEAWALERLGC